MKGLVSILSVLTCAVSFGQVSGPGLTEPPDGNNLKFLTATVSGPSQVVKNAFFIITVVGKDSDTHPSQQADGSWTMIEWPNLRHDVEDATAEQFDEEHRSGELRFRLLMMEDANEGKRTWELTYKAADFAGTAPRVGGVAARVFDTAAMLSYHYDVPNVVQKTVEVRHPES